jgi:hypothetical protein
MASGQVVFPLFSHPMDILDDWPLGAERGGGCPPTHPIPHNMDQWKLGHLQPHKGHQAHTTSSIQSCSQHTTSISHKSTWRTFPSLFGKYLVFKNIPKRGKILHLLLLKSGRDLTPTSYSRLSLVENKTKGGILHLLLKTGRDLIPTIP